MRTARLAEPSGGVRPSPGIAELFPPGVVATELLGAADVADLDPEEARSCAGFAAKRTADFAAGRLCARRALRDFGHAAVALRIGADRRPRWPEGIVGSISHTTGYCGVVVASSTEFESIGFDAEIVGGVGEELWPALFTASEIDELVSLAPSTRAARATLAFSAKEAYYKCHFGITPSWLDFTDVVVTFATGSSQFGAFAVWPARHYRGLAVPRAGRFSLDGDIALTGVGASR